MLYAALVVLADGFIMVDVELVWRGGNRFHANMEFYGPGRLAQLAEVREISSAMGPVVLRGETNGCVVELYCHADEVETLQELGILGELCKIDWRSVAASASQKMREHGQATSAALH